MTAPDRAALPAPPAAPRHPVPAVPGAITAEQVVATARSIAAVQQADGGVPWPQGHVDAWNHVECLMAMTTAGLVAEARHGYAWLVRHQRPDGSWPMKLVDGAVAEPDGESNHAAYVAVGVWHDLLVTGDTRFAAAMWPVVRRALDFAVGLQTARGEIRWRRSAAGEPAGFALLTGCSSIYQGLRCGVSLGERLGEPQPDWELAADRLGHVIAAHPEAFADKSRFSMDWYYPVLGGAVRGPAALRRLDEQWDTFVVPGLGARCVSDQPWVTGAESCELVMALDAAGDRERALTIFGDMQRLRHEDGSYWTGWQFANRAWFPHEQSAYTAAAVVLAADALAGATPAAALFRDAGRHSVPAGDPAACGCSPTPTRA
ncbi:prenyltransferase [Sphaerisporangium rufum]|uniref:Prenyltransferase n=1 Tax=Sphaerisporangium rufum TaxID=1381558 RepID=A0A919R6V8_9ACTN|nr:prenyltransferase [Sphaerisporangium rufum]GII79360.1 prenyltransferase [Sphaerisporangium rufum]